MSVSRLSAPRRPVLLFGAAATLAAALTLSACSSGTTSSAGTTSSSTSSSSGNTTSSSGSSSADTGSSTAKSITANLSEFHIALSSSKVAPGTYTFKVKNVGDITHALTVTGPGVSSKTTGDMSPGASATLTVTLKAGSYDVFCPVGDHKMEGMDETMTVS